MKFTTSGGCGEKLDIVDYCLSLQFPLLRIGIQPRLF